MESNEVGYFIFQHDEFPGEEMWPLDENSFKKDEKKNQNKLRQTAEFQKRRLALWLLSILTDAE